jgi:hypothetical protein
MFLKSQTILLYLFLFMNYSGIYLPSAVTYIVRYNDNKIMEGNTRSIPSIKQFSDPACKTV